MVRVPQKLPILLDSQHSCWLAGRRASVWASNWSPPRPCGDASSPSPDASPVPPAASPCICPSAGPGKPTSCRPWPGCAPCRSLPDATAGVRPPLHDLTAVPLTGASPTRQCHFLPATWPISPITATAGRHIFTGVATGHHPQPHLLASGLARSPSLTRHPYCQRPRLIPSVDSG